MSIIERSLEKVLTNNSIDSSRLISKLVNVILSTNKRSKSLVWRSSSVKLANSNLYKNTKTFLKICDILIKNEALLAGGSVLSAFSDFSINDLDIYVNEKNVYKIYKDLKNIGYKIQNECLAPAYDQSFFRKNHIMARFRLDNPDFLPIDLMIIPDDIPLVRVVTNFDLSFCETWFDGQIVYAVDPVGIKNKEGILKPAYIESLFKYFNFFITKRIEKYGKRGFKISYTSPSSTCTFLHKTDEIKDIMVPNGTIRLLNETTGKYVYPEEWVVKFILNKFYNINCQKDFNLYYNFSLKEFTWQELFSMLKRYYHITPLSYGIYSYTQSILESIPMPIEYRWVNPANSTFPEDASPEFKEKRVNLKVKLLIKYLILNKFKPISLWSDIQKNKKWEEYINKVLNDDIKNEERVINGENFYINFTQNTDTDLTSDQRKMLTDILYIQDILKPLENDKPREIKNIIDFYFLTINQRSSISYYKNNYLIPNDFDIFDIELFEDTTINDWLLKDPTNLVFLYNSVQTNALNGIKGIGLTKNSLYQLYAKLIVECKSTNIGWAIYEDNVIIDKIYNVLTVGDSLNNGILLSKLNCVKDEVDKKNGNRIFYLIEGRLLKAIAGLSSIIYYRTNELNIHGSEINLVSAVHCEEGQETNVYDEIFIIDKSKLVSRIEFNRVISSGIIPIEETNIYKNKYEEISSKISSFIEQIKIYTFENLENALIENDDKKIHDILTYIDVYELNTLSNNLGRMTPLMYAASKNYLNIVIELIDKGVELDILDDNKYTALMYAAGNDHPDIVKILIDGHADINIQNAQGNTALIFAADNDHPDIVKILIDEDADINIQNNDGMTALDVVERNIGIAFKQGDDYSVSKSISNSLRNYINRRNQEENENENITPLITAVNNGDLDEVNVLLSSSTIDINSENNQGNTALMYACKHGHTQIVNALIEAGANINLQNMFGETALIYACRYNHPDIVNILINNDVDIDIQSNDGYTALMHASIGDNERSVRLLIGEGVDKDAQNNWKETALMLAVKNNKFAAANALIDLGVGVDIQDDLGNTALIIAVKSGNKDMVNMLIESGVDVDIQDDLGDTALIIAAKSGNMDMVIMLIESGANPNITNLDEKTAIEVVGDERTYDDDDNDDDNDKIITALQEYIDRENYYDGMPIIS